MQNVVNYIVPFFGNDGKPISAGRVFFCNKNTSARTSGEIQPPDLILVKDKDGSPLQNPLPLDDSGRFTTQPFVDYDVDFKMYVDEPTGLPPLMDDDSPCWNTVLVMSSFDNKFVKVEYGGAPCVGSISELRDLDVENGKAIVLGYNEAGDFCPPRVFQFVNVMYSENYGTHIVSRKSVQGCWVCEPTDYVDVRWFGLNPRSGVKTDFAERIVQIYNSYPGKPIYFPSGTYYIGRNISLNALILDYGANVKPFNDTVRFQIEKLENRGGTFQYDSSSLSRVVPVLKSGVLRTSWLSGVLVGFVFYHNGSYTNIFENVETVIFDNDSIDYGSIENTVEVGSVVINAVSREIPSYINASVCVDVKLGGIRGRSIGSGNMVIGDGVISYNKSPIMNFDEESDELIIRKKANIADIDSTNVKTDKLTAKSVTVNGKASIGEIDATTIGAMDVTANGDIGTASGDDADGESFAGIRTCNANVKNIDEAVSSSSTYSLAAFFPDATAGNVYWLNFKDYGSDQYGRGLIKVLLSGYAKPRFIHVHGYSMLPFYCIGNGNDGQFPIFHPMFDVLIEES